MHVVAFHSTLLATPPFVERESQEVETVLGCVHDSGLLAVHRQFHASVLFQTTMFVNQNVLPPSATADTAMPLCSRCVLLSHRSSLLLASPISLLPPLSLPGGRACHALGTRISHVCRSSSRARHPVTPRVASDVLISVTTIRFPGFATTDRLATTVLRNEANKGSLFVTAYTIIRHGT